MRSNRWLVRSFLFGLLLACGDPEVARAQLAAPFADTITVDTQYVTGANNATDIAFSADGRAVVTLKNGTVVVRRSDGTKNMVTGLFGMVDTGSEKGLLGVVAHPDVATNNTFFFYVSNGTDNNDKHRVYSGVLDASDDIAVDMGNPVIAASRDLGPGLRGPANHDGGGLFVHNGQLYIGVGDTGANMTPPVNKYSSCLNLANGKILRVNLDGSIPTDNPLVNEAMVTACDSTSGTWSMAAPDERIFAWGFRNPWRFWIDPHTNLMWIGDVGETTREEISVGPGGQHYGYPFREGTTNYDGSNGRGADGSLQNMHCMTMSPSRSCTGPVHDYDNNMVGNCVIGGLIPEGCGWTDAFDGKLYYLFGDHGPGWVRALEVQADRMGVVSSTAVDFGDFAAMSSFRQGPDGAVYMVLDMTGAVYRFSPTNLTGPDCMGGGGMGGAGGMGGSAGAATGGGSGGSGGGGTGGAGVTGGANTTGGTPATGGSGMNGGSAGSSAGAGGADGGGESKDEGGCGCRTAGGAGRPIALALLGLGLAVALGRRRTRR